MHWIKKYFKSIFINNRKEIYLQTKCFKRQGDNWKYCPEKPVALIFWAPKCQYNSIVAYLKDYRVVFELGYKSIVWHDILTEIPSERYVVGLWGNREHSVLKKIIAEQKIDFFRLHEGMLPYTDAESFFSADCFEKRGDNWKYCPEKPVALIFRAPKYQYDHIVEYLQNYRVVFGFGKRNWPGILTKIPSDQYTIGIWGDEESAILKKIIAKRKIDFFRLHAGMLTRTDVESFFDADCFEKRGDNWKNCPEKPIALILRAPKIKYICITECLKEYRVAFGFGKHKWRDILIKIKADQYTIGIWGDGESATLKNFITTENLGFFRIHDGFLCSVDENGPYSTSYSIVIDDIGIYYNATIPSKLEAICNKYDFHEDKSLLQSAENLWEIFTKFSMGKINKGTVRNIEYEYGPKIKKRILVIWQNENDSSCKQEQYEHLSCRELLQSAIQENPDADFFCCSEYGTKENILKLFNAQEYDKKITVIDGSIPLAKVFQIVDHVYTISSSAGMEALLYGLPVTVLGTPFYAGWGLTDDRRPIPRRSRTLSLIELFTAVYLLYPRYSLVTDDAVTAFLATVFRLAAERRISLNATLTQKITLNHVKSLSNTEYWAVLLKNKEMIRDAKKINIDYMISNTVSVCHKKVVLYALASLFSDRIDFLKRLISHVMLIMPHLCAEFINDLLNVAPHADLYPLLATAYKLSGDTKSSDMIIEMLVNEKVTIDLLQGNDESATINYNNILCLAQNKIEKGNYNEAEALLCKLLLAGFFDAAVFTNLAKIAAHRFDFISAAAILCCFTNSTPLGRGSARLFSQKAVYLAVSGKFYCALESFAMALYARAEKNLGFIFQLEPHFFNSIGELPYNNAWNTLINSDHNRRSFISNATSYMIASQFDKAKEVLLKHKPDPDLYISYYVLLARILKLQRKYVDALKIMEPLFAWYPLNRVVYSEYLSVLEAGGHFSKGGYVLDNLKSQHCEINELVERKILIGNSGIGEYYGLLKKTERNIYFQKYISKDKWIKTLNDFNKYEKIVIIANFGPGDEIRFASVYANIAAQAPSKQITYIADHRLVPLFQRSYKDSIFHPTIRLRGQSALKDSLIRNFNKLPSSGLVSFADNEAWDVIQNADGVTLAINLLGDMLTSYSSFSGEPYLMSDREQVKKWENRLPHNNKKLVGISWRSSITTFARDMHYLDVEELAPVFEIQEIQFVNLQYDKCTQELEWINERYPGAIINFEDLDQMNDLDNVAALMSSLDLIISPATTVIELAGALGCKGYLLSNAHEIRWRKKPGTTIDCWHNSIEHIEGDVIGDKKLLVQALIKKLHKFLDNS